ncbi:MAG: hypothetical protein JRC92_02840 [Deltaproteobacteria bacterium]|nr:hypothetical protein [Deltaproteobacteria bacterium]
MKKKVWLLAAISAALLIAAPSLGLSEAKYGGRLVYGIEGDMEGTDPHKAVSSITINILSLAVETLVDIDKNGAIQPCLAESWEVSPDAKEWTFHLRRGVKFHNGREFIAEDVKFNLDRVTAPEAAFPIGAELSVVESCEVMDQYTIKFTLKEPLSSFLARLYAPNGGATFSILAPECVDEEGGVSHPIGTGPFEFVEWKNNDQVKLKRFDGYWVKWLPYLDEVVVKPLPDMTVRLTALKAGDVDATRLFSLIDAAKLAQETQKKVVVDVSPIGLNLMVHFNLSKPPFNDRRVRQAVAQAINKEDFLAALGHGYGETISQFVYSFTPWYTEVDSLAYDIEKAKALLAKAGYPDGIEITIQATTAYQETIDVATILQQQLKEIGLNLTLEVSDWATHIGKAVNGEFIMAVNSFGTIKDPDSMYPRVYTPDGGWAFITGRGYDNPQVTKLIKEASVETDFDKRKAAYAQVAGMIVEDTPLVFIITLPTAFGWQSYLKGYEPAVWNLAYSGGGLPYAWLER